MFTASICFRSIGVLMTSWVCLYTTCGRKRMCDIEGGSWLGRSIQHVSQLANGDESCVLAIVCSIFLSFYVFTTDVRNNRCYNVSSHPRLIGLKLMYVRRSFSCKRGATRRFDWSVVADVVCAASGLPRCTCMYVQSRLRMTLWLLDRLLAQRYFRSSPAKRSSC